MNYISLLKHNQNIDLTDDLGENCFRLCSDDSSNPCKCLPGPSPKAVSKVKSEMYFSELADSTV